jgi:hypothetical protein
LAVSVARIIWRDSLAKIADTKIIGIDTQWFIWYNLSSVPQDQIMGHRNRRTQRKKQKRKIFSQKLIKEYAAYTLSMFFEFQEKP